MQFLKMVIVSLNIGKYVIMPKKLRANSFSDSSSERNSSENSNITDDEISTVKLLQRKRNNNEELDLSNLEK